MYLTTLTLRPCREMVVSTSPALFLQGRLWGGHQEVMALKSSCRSSFWASSSAGDTKLHSFTKIWAEQTHNQERKSELVSMCVFYGYFVETMLFLKTDRPGQRLSVEELCGPPEEAQSGWRQEPRACGAGQKTNIGIWPASRAPTWWSYSPQFSAEAEKGRDSNSDDEQIVFLFLHSSTD